VWVQAVYHKHFLLGYFISSIFLVIRKNDTKGMVLCPMKKKVTPPAMFDREVMTFSTIVLKTITLSHMTEKKLTFKTVAEVQMTLSFCVTKILLTKRSWPKIILKLN